MLTGLPLALGFGEPGDADGVLTNLLLGGDRLAMESDLRLLPAGSSSSDFTVRSRGISGSVLCEELTRPLDVLVELAYKHNTRVQPYATNRGFRCCISLIYGGRMTECGDCETAYLIKL